jgi:NADH-quinone oxidoreductase subunit C
MNDTVQTTPEERLLLLEENLRERFESAGCEISRALGEVTMVVPREQLLTVTTELRDAKPFRFEELIDLCGVDYSNFGEAEWDTAAASTEGYGRGIQCMLGLQDGNRRFAVVYHLLSVRHNHRLRLRTFVDTGEPIVASVVDVWSSADWFEREAFDLFGILFDGHPDLRRILTDYGFIGHPFRKDFPLIGQVEMRYDPEQQRVIYQPVTIKQRPQVPKVIRDDNRYLSEEQKPQGGTDA